jgi:hypothetical protein
MPLKLAILKVCVWFQARMAKLADAADLKSYSNLYNLLYSTDNTNIIDNSSKES